MPKIQLTKGFEATVDKTDFVRVSQFKWYALVHSNTVYACRHEKGPDGKRKTVYLHRFILNAPDDMMVDHVSGNGLNCGRKNLRLCTHWQNQYNRGHQADNTSGYKGVSWSKKNYNWVAQIRYGGKGYFLGYFATKEEAADAYRLVAEQQHGEFARLKVPRSKMAAMETKKRLGKPKLEKADKGPLKVDIDD